jgi:molybdopterin-guanine dinucleotide biosynthesis protein A
MKHATTSILNGLILAGGKSVRMGQDKSLIEYHNVSQREYLFAMLKEFLRFRFYFLQNQSVGARSSESPAG